MAKHGIPKGALERIAQRFKTLGELSRLQLLLQLMEHGEMTVMHLVQASGQQQANVSKHLNLLAREGILARRREGLNVYYRIDDPTINDLCVIVCDRLQEQAAANEKILGTV